MGKGASDNSDKAAAISGEFSRETARDTTYADRADQYNPFGSLTYDQNVVIDPATGERTTKWTQSQQFSPEIQKLYDNQLGNINSKAELSAGMRDRVAKDMGTPADFDQFGQPIAMEYDPTELRQKAEDAAYGRQTSRLDPQFQGQAEELEIKLRNQGLRPGDQAYESQMAGFGRDRNDAYEQARMGSTGIGMQEAGQLWNQQVQGNEMTNALRDKEYQEYIDKRGFSLGEMNALDPTQQITDLTKALGTS